MTARNYNNKDNTEKDVIFKFFTKRHYGNIFPNECQMSHTTYMAPHVKPAPKAVRIILSPGFSVLL